MDDAGIFDPEARLELIDGVILEMSPTKPPHAYAVNTLTRQFSRLLGDRAYVNSQNPTECDEYSLPQPDVTLAELPHERYSVRHPTWEDTLLAVEVSDSTVREDRKVKVPLYARSERPETWVVNIPQRRVEVYMDPVDGQYRTVTLRFPGETVAPSAFSDVEIAVSDLLPLHEGDDVEAAE